VWEAGTGELLTDKETTKLIASVKDQSNQLGEHSFKSMRTAYRNRRIWQKAALAPALPDWQQVIVGLKEFIISKPGQFHDKIVAKGKREGALLTYQSIFLSKQKHQEREEEEVLYNNTHMYTVCCVFSFF
jgi:hypothetical protein